MPLSNEDVTREIKYVKQLFEQYLKGQTNYLSRAHSAEYISILPLHHLPKIQNYIINGSSDLPDVLKNLKLSSTDRISRQLLYIRQRTLWQLLYKLYQSAAAPVTDRETYVAFLQETHAALTKNYGACLAQVPRVNVWKFRITTAAILCLGVASMYFLYKGFYLGLMYTGLMISASGVFLKKLPVHAERLDPPPPIAALRSNVAPIATVKPYKGLAVMHPVAAVAPSQTAAPSKRQSQRQLAGYSHTFPRSTHATQQRQSPKVISSSISPAPIH